MKAQDADVPYVVATGEISAFLNSQHPHDIVSINQLLDDLASRLPDKVAVGMPEPVEGSDEWKCKTLSECELFCI